MYRAPPPPTPAPNEPGTFGQQLAAICLSLYLARKRNSTANKEWEDARCLAIPHATKKRPDWDEPDRPQF